MKRILSIILFTTIFLLAWQLGENAVNQARVASGDTSLELFVASPYSIAKTFTEDGGLIFSELTYTLARSFVGLLLGMILALAASLLFLIFPSVRNVLFPLSFALNSFPVVGFAPIIILAFGQGSWLSIVFVSMIISYFPLLVGLDNAFKNVEREILDVMKVFNATKRQLISKIFLPAAVPAVLVSLRLAIPASIIGATIGEWLGTRNGIGQLITIALYQLRPGLLYASLISVTLVGIACVGIVVMLEKKLLVWKK